MRERTTFIDRADFRGACFQIIKNWWIVLCWAIAVFLAATAVGTIQYQPMYTASSTLVIRVMGADAYTSLSQTTQMTAVYREIFQSEALRNLVSQSIGEEVEGTISCSQIAETNLLVLSTSSPTPRQAYLFIQAALQNYENVTGYVFSDAVLEVVQEPTVPETPSNQSFFIAHRLNFTILAGVVAAVLIALIYLIRFTVKSEKDASSMLDGPILGTIPFEQKHFLKKAGSHGSKVEIPALLINSPLVSMNFSEYSRRMATRLESHMISKNYHVVLVCSVEENEGKSTIAANIATTLSEHGQRVLLLDGDFRKPAQYKIFDEKDQQHSSLSDVLMGTVSWKQAIFRNEKTGFWQLFQYHPIAQPGSVMSGDRLSELLKQLQKDMDYIVVDCSPVAVAADAEIWMHHVDTAVVVVRQDTSDVRIINDTVDLIWKSVKDFSGFVLNAFHKDPVQSAGRGYYAE